MNSDDARRLGQAQADFLPAEGMVLVVTDGSTAADTVEAYVEGLRLQGRDVMVQHDVSFEDAARATGQFKAAGCAYLSAGSVVMTDETGEKLPVETVMDIMRAAEADNFVPAMEQGHILHEPPAATE